jgi:hypothetical protein
MQQHGKELKACLQPSSKESGKEYASQAEQNKLQKETNSEDECSTKKQKRPHPAYQIPQPLANNNSFAPLRDLALDNVQTGSEGNCTKALEQMTVREMVGHVPSS